MTIVIVGLVALIVVAAFWDREPAAAEFDDIASLQRSTAQRAALRRISGRLPEYEEEA